MNTIFGRMVLAIISAFVFVISTTTMHSQFIEDALRYSQPNGIITARAGALGIAYTGISDDYAAIFYNPAGLSLITKSELTFGMGFQRTANSVNFMQQATDLSANDAYLSSFGMVFPFQTKVGNASIGFGYLLESNFANKYQYNGFNPRNTMTAYQAAYGTRNYQDNWANHVWLANDDLYSPIKDSLYQSAFIEEKGGLHDVIAGVAFDVAPSVSVGLNIIGKFGNYAYNRNYNESDLYNKYNAYDSVGWSNLDFQSLRIDETIKQDVFGITGSIGLQGRISKFMRLNANIKFPTYYQIDEDYNVYAQSTFDDGWQPNPYDPEDPFEISYRIKTPFTYSAGLSFHAEGLTITGGIEYMDATQVEFSDANGQNVTNIGDIRRYFESLNREIVRQLVGQVSWGIGAEWDLPLLPIVVRAAFQSTTSPYTFDVAGADNNMIMLGGGLYLANNVRLDGFFRWNSYAQQRTNYGTDISNGSFYKIATSPLNIALQLTFRY